MNQAVLESKKNVVSEIQNKFTGSSSTVVAEYRGLSVAEVTELRRALMKENVELKVYKNTLASKAADAAGYGELSNVLTGPNAMAFGGDETGAARVMAKFAKKHKTINALAALPNREGMLSMLLSVLQAPVSSFARVVKAVGDAKPADGAAAPAESAPAAEAAEAK